MIKAVSTGSTIVLVSDSSQTIPATDNRIPIRSQEAVPRSRSQSGARKTPRSSDGPISIVDSSAWSEPCAGAPAPASDAAQASSNQAGAHCRQHVHGVGRGPLG